MKGETSQSDTLLEDAKTAVRLLGIDDFIERNKKDIYDQLERCLLLVAEAEQTGALDLPPDAAFIAEALPLISGIVNVGSNRDTFDKAAAWVQTLIPGANSGRLLSTLTFLYIVDQGRKDSTAQKGELTGEAEAAVPAPEDEKKQQEKERRWDRIYKGAKWLYERHT